VSGVSRVEGLVFNNQVAHSDTSKGSAVIFFAHRQEPHDRPSYAAFVRAFLTAAGASDLFMRF
jgi:hypothetical protein